MSFSKRENKGERTKEGKKEKKEKEQTWGKQ